MNSRARKSSAFLVLKEHLQAASSLAKLTNTVNELNRITEIVHSNFHQLRDICYCGALDEEDDLLVIYVKHNAAFYLVNNLIQPIQDALFENGIYTNKLLVKMKPIPLIKPRDKHKINKEQYQMLTKFATAIDRDDLLKPLPEQDEASEDDDTCFIKL